LSSHDARVKFARVATSTTQRTRNHAGTKFFAFQERLDYL
jgi:hypothetical protein